MPVVIIDVARPPEACWTALTRAELFAAWMPGLRRATVVATEPDGLPREVAFEFSTSLSYALVYTYDRARREVRWDPRLGARDAVRGSARIDAQGDGARITYHLEQGPGRDADDLALGDADTIVGAFVRWIETQR